MKHRWVGLIAGLALLTAMLTACDEGIDDWDDSARVSGWVFTDPSHTQGVPDVKVIIEADPNSEVPYQGPDRWTQTDAGGHYEGAVFLGRENGVYNYVGDLSVTYFYNNMSFSWTGGVTVSPGSSFTLPPVDLTLFAPLGQ